MRRHPEDDRGNGITMTEKTISIQVDDEKFTTGMMLELMGLQSQLSGSEPHAALGKMISMLQNVVTSIQYGDDHLDNLTQLPFRHLKTTMSQIMESVTKTDPN